MGWRGTLRAIQAAERRAERDAQRRHRELVRYAKVRAKLSTLEQARLEVNTYENQLDLLSSIHKEQGEVWNWPSILNQDPPCEPTRTHHRATEVQAKIAAYKPGFFEKLLGGAKKKNEMLALELHVATTKDEQDFQNAWSQYQNDLVQCEDERRLAAAVLEGNQDAYVRVLKEMSPFSELAELGSSLSFRVHSPKLIEASVMVKGEQAIPNEIKSLTASGKVSKKAMPKGRFHEIYQDYVSGCVLRVARELFALLPIDAAIVTASADLFDSATGRTTEQPILSMAIDRSVVNRLNFERLDPSDAIGELVHSGDFKGSRRTGAFVPIQPLTVEDLSQKIAPPVVPKSQIQPLAAVNPLNMKWSDALRCNQISFGFLRMTVNELATLLGYQPQENFNLTQSKVLVRATEQLGYCVEPDPRYGAGNFWGTRELGLFRPPSGAVIQPSETYLGASALLQLCLLVAAADGTVDRSELDQFRVFIEGHFHFNPDENQRLTVLETLLARNAATAKVTLGRAAKKIPPEKHISVGHFLVNVAAADGVISPNEHKALVRIFEAIGLPIDNLQALIKLSVEEDETIIEAGECAPPPQKSTPSTQPKFQLDMSRVATISAETNEVIGILAKAMVEEEEESVSMPSPVQSCSAPALEPAVAVPIASKYSGLDLKYQHIAGRIFTKDQWTRAEFAALAQENNLMFLSVFDALNEWADEHLGDFVLEGDDPILVQRSLLISE
jgi:tellurite resistance protein